MADLQDDPPGGDVWHLQHLNQRAQLQLIDPGFILRPQVAAESPQRHQQLQHSLGVLPEVSGDRWDEWHNMTL